MPVLIIYWKGGRHEKAQDSKKTGTQQTHRTIYQEMTRGQYLAMCLIGALAVLAFMEAQTVAAKLRNVITPAPLATVGGGIL